MCSPVVIRLDFLTHHNCTSKRVGVLNTGGIHFKIPCHPDALFKCQQTIVMLTPTHLYYTSQIKKKGILFHVRFVPESVQCTLYINLFRALPMMSPRFFSSGMKVWNPLPVGRR